MLIPRICAVLRSIGCAISSGRIACVHRVACRLNACWPPSSASAAARSGTRWISSRPRAGSRAIRAAGLSSPTRVSAPQNLVRELSKLNNPVDTLEARLAIEPPQARLAALRATRGDIDKLFEAAEASRDAKDPGSYEKADAAFHRRVAAAARNPLLIAIFDAVLEIASRGELAAWPRNRPLHQ